MLFSDLDPQENKVEKLDSEILAEAIDLELLEENGQIVNEARRKANWSTEVKKIKVTKEQKLNKLIKRTALLMAKEVSDSDYKRWKKIREQANTLRAIIEKKFASKAKAKAKAIITNSNISSKKDVGGTITT